MREMRPVFSRPTFVHDLPASVDRQTPQPSEMLLRMNGSPVPTQTTLGSDGATASEPIDETGWSSKMGFQWSPPSVVFQRPPDAAPA
jgi:hypothetical protein